MLHSLYVGEFIKHIIIDLALAHEKRAQFVEQISRQAISGRVNFHAIARGKNHCLLRTGFHAHRCQQLGQFPLRQRELLAHVYRRGPMIYSKANDRHHEAGV